MRQHELNAQKAIFTMNQKAYPLGLTAIYLSLIQVKLLVFFLPITVLVAATIYFMISSGADALAADSIEFSVIGAFEKTDVAWSLFYGALIGLAATVALVVSQGLEKGLLVKGLVAGARSMLPAIYILLFAWTIAGVIGQLETGKYMASLASGNIPFALLPAVLFVLAGLTAFSTGTSWGTFGIMLPIAADMAMGTHTNMMLPMLAAVLAGAVFGDHCSPISDTTILSSTGANCHHIDHVLTQLPYAVIVAIISLGGYTVLGFTESLTAGLLTCTVLFIISVLILRVKSKQPA